jgi:hypothetical protein
MQVNAEYLIAVVPTAPLWLPFVWMLMRIMGKTTSSQKRGLALAVALGPYPLIFSSFFALAAETYTLRAAFAIYAVLHLFLVVSAVKTYYVMNREPSDRGVLLNRLVGGFVVFIFAAILIPHMMPSSRLALDEASAVTSTRAINRAQSSYAEKHLDKGFAATLSELSQGPGTGFIDEQLVSGRKTRYTFTMIVSPTDSCGRITTYAVVARPERFGRDGVRSFFIDESGVIRYAAQNRPPTLLDPPI